MDNMLEVGNARREIGKPPGYMLEVGNGPCLRLETFGKCAKGRVLD